MSSIFRAFGKSASENFRLRGVADFVELCGVPLAGVVLLVGLAEGSATQRD